MSKYPALAVGMRITADLLSLMQSDVTVKNVSQDRVSTTTLADDAELFGIALDVGTYEVQADLMLMGGAGGIAVKTRWSFTGTWNTPVRQCTGPSPSNTAAPNTTMSMQSAGYAANSDCVYGLSTSAAWSCARELSRQVIVTAAGNLAINWAPNVSSASSGGLRAGSCVKIRKIAS